VANLKQSLKKILPGRGAVDLEGFLSLE